MRQIKAILELRYENVPELFTHKKKILNALGESSQSDDTSFVEHINIQVKNQYGHIAVEAFRTVITVERTEVKKAQEFILGVYSRLENILNIKDVKQIGYRCFFIDERDAKFEDLVSIYKENFYKDSALLASAVDVAVPLTFKLNGYRVNFMSGPMEPAQVKDMLEYKDIVLKNSFFVDLDFIKYDEQINSKSLKEHIKDVTNRQKELLTKLEEVIYE